MVPWADEMGETSLVLRFGENRPRKGPRFVVLFVQWNNRILSHWMQASSECSSRWTMDGWPFLLPVRPLDKNRLGDSTLVSNCFNFFLYFFPFSFRLSSTFCVESRAGLIGYCLVVAWVEVVEETKPGLLKAVREAIGMDQGLLGWMQCSYAGGLVEADKCGKEL